MFSNLMHLEFLRLIKSRYLKAALSLALFVLILLYAVIGFVAADIFAEIANAYSFPKESCFQILMCNISINVCWFVGLFTVIIVTCDYYKYRLYINFHSQIKSKIHYCASEFAGFFLFSCLLALIPLFCSFFASFQDEKSLFHNFYRVIFIYGACTLSLFYNCIPGIFFAKLFKKVWPSIIMYSILILGGNFFFSFLMGMITTKYNAPINASEFITGEPMYDYLVSIISPDNFILRYAYGAITDYSELPRITFNIVMIILFWICASSLVTRKKVDK